VPTGAALGIVAAAFVLRLAWGLAAGVTPGAAGPDDALWYDQSARSLLRGDGYVSPLTGAPTAMWPPGYPAILAAAYGIAGATPATAVALNAAFGALGCWLVWRLGLRLLGARGALVAATLLAVFPSHVAFAALTLSETVFMALVCGLLLGAVRLVERPTAPGWLVWGFAAGVTAHVRSEAMALVAVPTVVLATRGAWRAALPVLVATVLGALVALTPWIVRNARLFGVLVPTSTSFGRTLWIGHNPLAAGGMTVAIHEAMERTLDARGPFPWTPAGELAMDRTLRADALDFAATHPGRELLLVPARVYHLFRGDHVWQAWYYAGTPRIAPSEAARRALGRLCDAYYVVVGLLALAGLVVRDASRPGWRVLDVAALAWIAIFAAVYGDPRFHHVLMPLACLLAAAALTRRDRAPRAAATA
jgi:hypothetical protein